jgi:hypothetical protein
MHTSVLGQKSETNPALPLTILFSTSHTNYYPRWETNGISVKFTDVVQLVFLFEAVLVLGLGS